jgi:autotransporter-associated beta strand protein
MEHSRSSPDQVRLAALTVITNSGGFTIFQNTASGGQAPFITNAGGVFDISLLSSTGTTVGSIAGAGDYFLGSKALTVGSNNLSTDVSGVVAEGGFGGGTGGSLVKVGAGVLTLSGVSSYSGPTNVNAGTLQAGAANDLAPSSAFTVASGATLGLGGFRMR